jgi:Polysaccharide lyase
VGFVLAASPALGAAAWEDFNGDFETGDFSQYLEVQTAPGRATIVKSPVAEGTYAARFERQVGDPPAAGSSRTEAVPDPFFHAGETLYFRHLLYLPFESIDWKHFLILCQWHDASGDPPPLSLQTFAKEGVKKLLIGSGTQESIYYDFGIPGSSEWFELVYRITFDVKGSIEVWLNGKSLGEVREIDTLGTEPTNWKLGNYRSSEAEGTTVIFQDGVMITKNFFSNPPGKPVEEEVGTPEPAVDAVTPMHPPSPSNPQAPDPLLCQLAKRDLHNVQVRLNIARRRYDSSQPRAQRRRSAKQIAQSAKRYRQAKQKVRRAC